MNRLNVAIRPLGFWIFLTLHGEGMFMIASIWLGHASIPLYVMKNPKNLRTGIWKVHFARLSLISYHHRNSKASSKCYMWSAFHRLFTTILSMYTSTISQHSSHQPLVSGARILQTKLHDFITVSAAINDEGSRFLAILIHSTYGFGCS